MIRILLIDDSAPFLAVLAKFLAAAPQLQVVGQALSGHEGLAQVARLQPDLVLLDLSLPDVTGLEVARHLKTQLNAPAVIILTLHNMPEYRLAAESAGVADFVLKEEVAVGLLPAIYNLFQLLPVQTFIEPGGADGTEPDLKIVPRMDENRGSTFYPPYFDSR